MVKNCNEPEQERGSCEERSPIWWRIPGGFELGVLGCEYWGSGNEWGVRFLDDGKRGAHT